MKRRMVCFAVALMLMLTGCGKGKTESVSRVESLDMGQNSFLMVTLEGKGAEGAQVQAIRQEKNSEKNYEDVETITLSNNEGNVYCALLPEGDNYVVRVTASDGTAVEHLAVFEEVQVCSLHISLNEKPSDGTRTLWPATPHNSADTQ